MTNVLYSSFTPTSFGAGNGDGAFNQGFATMSARMLPSGVWITSNAQIFDPEQCDKLITDEKFVPRRLTADEQGYMNEKVFAVNLANRVSSAVASNIQQLNLDEAMTFFADKTVKDIEEMFNVRKTMDSISKGKGDYSNARSH